MIDLKAVPRTLLTSPQFLIDAGWDKEIEDGKFRGMEILLTSTYSISITAWTLQEFRDRNIKLFPPELALVKRDNHAYLEAA